MNPSTRGFTRLSRQLPHPQGRLETAQWVRFGRGGVKEIDGVMVLDIRDTVCGVCEAGI
ncbi:hypothetical protein [Actinacidiphila sp. bgisy144]|uniref:hypothetical protein n=1 Tax=Actinacidiphila sp. bgisy144 TaxID=3413791 RepID=UPI003EB7D9EA